MTEFEYFYQQISYHTTHLSRNEQEELKGLEYLTNKDCFSKLITE